MQTNEWLFPAGTTKRDGWSSVIDAQVDGWRHTGIRIGEPLAGTALALDAGEVERIVVPLAGSFRVHVGDGGGVDGDGSGGDGDGGAMSHDYELGGRSSVFDGPTDVLYAGAGCSLSIRGSGRVAVAEAPASVRKPTQYIARDDVPVELRGAGRSSRQVHNFGTPGALDAAKLIVCEVITPAENWSSYPAHKHDEHVPGVESRLEEIYYFETAVTRGASGSDGAAPFGMFATYTSSGGEMATNALVRTGDIALVPFGYHGPAAAAPGYDLYYLNVMAGPDDERVWNITDDPAHAWVRGMWDGQEIDPRLPYARLNGDNR
ncbi:5-deoxy-glucuronate isomerase [Rathayibacter soli]|uniref:5-deoxy-glucuronate isomerase n=1 Tax=Rathayibacter soli TaxID=3144168 RepID=UPI0027E46768|nr:5-deoxy-glucuronate isomerase [Glaciibacter superstes]